jgi:hypothetical protein
MCVRTPRSVQTGVERARARAIGEGGDGTTGWPGGATTALRSPLERARASPPPPPPAISPSTQKQQQRPWLPRTSLLAASILTTRARPFAPLEPVAHPVSGASSAGPSSIGSARAHQRAKRPRQAAAAPPQSVTFQDQLTVLGLVPREAERAARAASRIGHLPLPPTLLSPLLPSSSFRSDTHTHTRAAVLLRLTRAAPSERRYGRTED